MTIPDYQTIMFPFYSVTFYAQCAGVNFSGLLGALNIFVKIVF